MTVGEAERILKARKLSSCAEETEITGVYLGDIMSRAIAGGFSGMLWITAQTDMNALAVACMKKAACLVFPDGLAPGADVIERAEREGVALLTCGCSAFEAAGRLYPGLQGEENKGNDADA